MPTYVNWLEFLATLPHDEAAHFKELEIEVLTEGDRLVWNCSDQVMRSDLIGPVLEQIPRILDYGFQEFEIRGKNPFSVCRSSLKLLARSL